MIYTVTISGDMQPFRANAVCVNQWSALSVASNIASFRLIACALAVVPKQVHDGDGQKVEHPLNAVLSYRVNPWTNATVGWSTLYMHKLTCGDGMMVVRQAAGSVYLHNIDSCNVQISLAPADDINNGIMAGEPIYHVAGQSYRYSQVLHVKNLSMDSYTGLDVVQLARRTIEAAINAEELARKFLRDGYNLAGVIEVPVPLDDAQLTTMQTSLKEGFKGLDNAGGAPVLPFGATFKPLTVSAAQAQLIETRQFLIEEFSRWWGVPQHLIGKLNGGGGYNSISQLGAEVVRYVLRYDVEQLEEELTNKLLTPAERAAGLHVCCDLSELERGNWEAAVAAANALVTGGIASDNEGRAWVGLPPVKDGDGRRDPSYAQRQPAGADDSNTPEQPAQQQDAEHANPQVGPVALVQPALDAAVARIEGKSAKALSKPLSVPAANVFADQQAGYVQQELGPVNAMLHQLGHGGIDAARLASRYADAIKRQVSTGEVASLAALVQGVL